MKMTTVREFRKHIASLMREGDSALITRHGKPSGIFLPLGEGTEIPMDLRMALIERIGAAVSKALAAKGATEKEVLSDFRRHRKTRRGR
jgi:antitoxin (DNA-binding transcriptional repressor) of toxin-antitoxin stability system